MAIRSINYLRDWFKAHQYRLAVGEKLISITDIARRAGCHRDTIYSLLAGERISGPIQNALSIVIDRIEQETSHQVKTSLWNIQLSSTGPKMCLGISSKPLLSAKR